MKCKGFVLLFAWLPMASMAQAPPCSTSEFRAFDFWLGEWQVHLANGQHAGDNSISRAEGGCLLTESWQGVQGGTGRSLNFYDPVAGHWRQVWVSPGGLIDISGNLVDGSMVLEGKIVYTGGPNNGQQFPFRGTWTPLEDGRVRQFFEQANTAGEWAPWFEGFYRKAKASPIVDKP